MSSPLFSHINLTEEESDYIDNLIDTFAETMPENWRWQLPFVQKYRAIPLYVGWTETTALTPNGDIVSWSTEEEYDGLRNVTDALIVRCSMMDGVKRYPKLHSLIPCRPINAVTCDVCNGTGVIPIPEFRKLICKCGGVGWLDP